MKNLEPTPDKARRWTLIYDGQCAFCRMLAGLVTGPTMTWEDFGQRVNTPMDSGPGIIKAVPDGGINPPPLDNPGDILMVRDPENVSLTYSIQEEDQVVTGHAAWNLLLQQEPGLARWAWLAERLGISHDSSAAAIRASAHFMRKSIFKFCPKCRPRQTVRWRKQDPSQMKADQP
jgi:hypothetical protein